MSVELVSRVTEITSVPKRWQLISRSHGRSPSIQISSRYEVLRKDSELGWFLSNDPQTRNVLLIHVEKKMKLRVQ
jgi:lipocalin